jgi:acetyl-CoA carboxylase biotin carboxyl carrier protein
MDFKQIQELIRMLGKSNISEFKLEQDDFKITIRTDSYNDGKTPIMMQAPQMHQMAAPPAPIAAAPVALPAPVAALPPPPAAPTAPDESKFLVIKSPMVGTFYRAAAPGKPAFVKIGDAVKSGQVVCMVEAMKLFNDIESEFSGTIVKILIEDAAPVEYDQPLFLVEP